MNVKYKENVISWSGTAGFPENAKEKHQNKTDHDQT